ncbi:MAG: hypothetical protein ACO3NK_01570 [Prochlorotrichaceae cyanobacterium]|jgi:hypothetical protein
MQILEDLMFFDRYKERFYVRRWNEAIVYRYCLLIPMETEDHVGLSILDPAGFELFLEGCYGCRFGSAADALVAGIKAVDQYIQEALHRNSIH